MGFSNQQTRIATLHASRTKPEYYIPPSLHHWPESGAMRYHSQEFRNNRLNKLFIALYSSDHRTTPLLRQLIKKVKRTVSARPEE